MEATEIKALTGMRGHAILYRLQPPMKVDGREVAHVVVSAVSVFGAPETYIFEADEHGEILNWSELDGSFKGDLDHESALSGAGYTVAPC